jgi:hypothetical protein
MFCFYNTFLLTLQYYNLIIKAEPDRYKNSEKFL